ncbi:MAG: hypothetical protein KKD48_03315, partial [Nanoarchaeota archaeon]|nr:hypothetical protein [Nanoarchaeota archaeon]
IINCDSDKILSTQIVEQSYGEQCTDLQLVTSDNKFIDDNTNVQACGFESPTGAFSMILGMFYKVTGKATQKCLPGVATNPSQILIDVQKQLKLSSCSSDPNKNLCKLTYSKMEVDVGDCLDVNAINNIIKTCNACIRASSDFPVVIYRGKDKLNLNWKYDKALNSLKYDYNSFNVDGKSAQKIDDKYCVPLITRLPTKPVPTDKSQEQNKESTGKLNIDAYNKCRNKCTYTDSNQNNKVCFPSGGRYNPLPEGCQSCDDTCRRDNTD